MANSFQEKLEDGVQAFKSHRIKVKWPKVKITDSTGVIHSLRYAQIDAMLLNPYTLIIFLPNRALLIQGTDLTELNDRLHEEIVTDIQPYEGDPDLGLAITRITHYWLHKKTAEELLREVMTPTPQNREKRALETVN